MLLALVRTRPQDLGFTVGIFAGGNGHYKHWLTEVVCIHCSHPRC